MQKNWILVIGYSLCIQRGCLKGFDTFDAAQRDMLTQCLPAVNKKDNLGSIKKQMKTLWNLKNKLIYSTA